MAAVQYASAAELTLMNLPAGALEGVSAIAITAMLKSNSALIQSYMRGRYKLPITGELPSPPLVPDNTFPPELVQACLAITAYDVLCFRGFNPDQYDANFKMRRDFYLGNEERGTKGWLDKLAAGAVSIDAAADASPLVQEGGGVAYDLSGRGFSNFEGNGLQASDGIGEPIGNFWNAPKPD